MASGRCNWSSQEVCQQAEVFEGNGLSFVDIFLFADGLFLCFCFCALQ